MTYDDTPLVVDVLIRPEERRLPSLKSRLWLIRYIWSDEGSVLQILLIEHRKLVFVAS